MVSVACWKTFPRAGSNMPAELTQPFHLLSCFCTGRKITHSHSSPGDCGRASGGALQMGMEIQAPRGTSGPYRECLQPEHCALTDVLGLSWHEVRNSKSISSAISLSILKHLPCTPFILQQQCKNMQYELQRNGMNWYGQPLWLTTCP